MPTTIYSHLLWDIKNKSPSEDRKNYAKEKRKKIYKGDRADL